MSGRSRTTATRGGRAGAGPLAVGLWCALAAASAPLLRVIVPGAWVAGVAILTGAVLAVGYGLRRAGVPAVGVTVGELAVWACALTGAFFSGDALFGFIPTGTVFADAVSHAQVVSHEILVGIAPMTPDVALSFAVVAAAGLLAVMLDHVVVTARMPLLAAVALIGVWLIPAIVVPSQVDVVGFVALAATVLFLLRVESGTRQGMPRQGMPGGTRAARPAGAATLTATIGVVAIVAAVLGGAALPPPTVPVAAGSGFGITIDPTLELGEDLRRPAKTPVMEVRTDAPTEPYLRLVTLSVFTGEVWQPDHLRAESLSDEGMQPVVADPDVRVTEYRTHVRITQLTSVYLPVAYPAVEVDGLQGIWRTIADNRTVRSGQSSTQGQEYDIVTHVPRPTLEQIEASRAVLDSAPLDVWSLPEDTPAIVGDLAQEKTEGATTDYEKLIRLQSWFRGSDFTYSLTAPVTDGFDGTGSDAVAAFLQEKSGYCVHFAAAFTLMARSLGMPARIVVGFLPGRETGKTEAGQDLTEVTSDQLHAWSEVYFEGIGWVPFEPTKSLGTATQFSAAQTPVDDGGVDVAGPTPTATPTPLTSAAGPTRDLPDEADASMASTRRLPDLRPFLTVLGTVLLLALLPGAAGWLRRWMLRRRGTVGSAWRLVQETAIDLGLPVPGAETPRALGARLVALGGAPAAETDRLVGAVERASYAPGGGAGGEAGGDAATAMRDAGAVRAGMLAALGPAARTRALALPRSLIVRPGSAFADRDAAA
ncbi:transglutaminaseTgpA domain-containing protein [Microbacterium sp.]|uniref:transglutaminase family protein n=1 Tax=Microbacterium sp. TaxID=51671 RepID=UPI0039E219E2